MPTAINTKRREIETKIVEAARHVRAGPTAQQRLQDLLAELDALPRSGGNTPGRASR